MAVFVTIKRSVGGDTTSDTIQCCRRRTEETMTAAAAAKAIFLAKNLLYQLTFQLMVNFSLFSTLIHTIIVEARTYNKTSI